LITRRLLRVFHHVRDAFQCRRDAFQGVHSLLVALRKGTAAASIAPPCPMRKF
jgi:hypothetical protein